MNREEAINQLNDIKSELKEHLVKKDIVALDMAISALSAEGEYIKKEDALNDRKIYALWNGSEKVYVVNADYLKSLPVYSFPDREKGVPEFLSKYEGEWVSADKEKQLYSDLLRVKHGTMNIDSLIDKVYADMRKEK